MTCWRGALSEGLRRDGLIGNQPDDLHRRRLFMDRFGPITGLRGRYVGTLDDIEPFLL
jgi:hypothetical protein